MARDDRFEFFGDFAAEGAGFGAVAHEGEGVDALAGDQKIDADEVFGAVVADFVVETGVAGGGGFELVVKISEEVGHGGLEGNDSAVFDVGEVGMAAAFLNNKIEDAANHGARDDNLAADPRFADFGDGGEVGEVGGGFDFE